MARDAEKGSVSQGMLVNEGATPKGRRDFGLADEIARVEQAAIEWGLHVDALEGQFVRALLKAIEETGKTNLATLGDLQALLEQARREGEADRRRVERLIEATSNALAMALRATENAGAASAHAQQMIDESVAGIQSRMSDALVKECPNWLILEQKFRHREYAWKLARWVSFGAMALFIGGYATSQYWNLRLTESRQAMFDAVDRCWVDPMKVRMSNGTTIDACPLADISPGRPK